MDTNRSRKRERNPNHEHSLYLANIIILCLITLASLGCMVFLFLQLRSARQSVSSLNTQVAALQEENASKYSQEDVDQQVSKAQREASEKERSTILMQIQSSLESGNTTTSMLRSLFSEDIVVVSNSKYYFFPVYESLAKSVVKSGDFEYDDTGTLQYVGSDTGISIERGVDISARNGTIDWQAVADDGIHFAMICAGSADEEGTIAADAALEENLKGAAARKMEAGVYFVMNAANTDEAKAQAAFVVEALKDLSGDVTYPVAVVVREPDNSSRLSSLSRQEYTDNIIAYCEAIKQAGYSPMIYGNLAAFLMQTDLTRLEDYDKWIADVSNNVYFPYRYTMWQYSTSGQVNGIEGSVHLDLRITKE